MKITNENPKYVLTRFPDSQVGLVQLQTIHLNDSYSIESRRRTMYMEDALLAIARGTLDFINAKHPNIWKLI